MSFLGSAEREVAGRSAETDPVAAFIDRVGFAMKREDLEELSFDVKGALRNGHVVIRDGRGAAARIVPASWLRGGCGVRPRMAEAAMKARPERAGGGDEAPYSRP